MTAFTDEALTCWVCTTQRATVVMEAQAGGESYFQPCCSSLLCLTLSAAAASVGDLVHVDTFSLGGAS